MSVPLLGQNKTTSDSPDFASLSDEDKERLAQMAEERENPDDLTDPEGIPVLYAFTVAQFPDGRYHVEVDVTKKFVPDRVATADDIVAASTVAKMDIEATKTSQFTAMHMAQMGRMMQEQAQAAQIRQQVMQGLGPR